MRRPRSRTYSLTVRALGPLVLLALWWAASATGVLTSDVLESPAGVVRAAGELWGNGQLVGMRDPTGQAPDVTCRRSRATTWSNSSVGRGTRHRVIP
ncbi:hypothetical protein [Streptomyces himalayensis]|uniref:hypothetical protein n=1 Tax=Streptomyces himalayensis TaxID=2820085 RepID=UPI0035A8B9D9